MTALVMNYTVNPIVALWKSLERSLIVAGHVRAAAELARMGYHKESKAIMMELKDLKASK